MIESQRVADYKHDMEKRVPGLRFAAALLVSLACTTAAIAEPLTLRVNTFPNAKALPLFAGQAQGIFARRELAIDLQFTENSTTQRAALAAGACDLVHSALDNAVAMKDVGGDDIVVVMGGDSGMNEFFVQPDIRSFEDLRGRVLTVDAPDTAYALQAKQILRKHGLLAGQDYAVKPVGGGTLRLRAMRDDRTNAAAILNLPFSIEAERAGLKSLGRTVDLLGPYQANGLFAMRPWVGENGASLERYIAAYIEALRWVLTPAHRPAAVALLVDRLKLAPNTAERTYDLLADSGFGFTPDAKLDPVGFHNMLALRAEVEGARGGSAQSPERYLDLTYYERALASAGR